MPYLDISPGFKDWILANHFGDKAGWKCFSCFHFPSVGLEIENGCFQTI